MRLTYKKGILYSAILLCAISLLLISNTLLPKTDAITYDDFRRKIFVNDAPAGLSSQTTYSILKDNDGFIWVSTRNGIDRYDGASFEHYKIGESKMRGIRDGMMVFLYRDDEGGIWAYTERSIIYCYDPKENVFKEVLNMPKRSIWGSAQALYKHGDILLVGASDGITCYNTVKDSVVKRICPDDNVRTLAAYRDGKILFGSQQGIGTIDLNEYRSKHQSWTDLSVNNLYYDTEKNRIWIGGYGSGVSVLDPDEPENIQSVEGTEGFVVMQFCPYEGNTLIAVDGAGLWSAQYGSDNYVKSTTLVASDTPEAPHLIKSSSVRSVLVDDENLWVAMYIGGIAQMQPPPPLIQVSNDLTHTISDLFAQGVSTDRNGNIWVAFEQGIGSFDPNGENPRFYLDHEAHFLSVQPAKDGTVWCGGFNSGLYHFNPNTGWKEHFNSIVDQPVKDCVYMIKEDQNGDIWVGGLNFPLTRLHYAADNTLEKKSYPGVNLVTDIEWLSPDTIVIGTTDGFTLIDTKTDSISKKLTDTEDWGGTNFISSIVTRHGHEIWMATQGAGIVCYDIDNDQQPLSAFNQDHGLPSLELRGMELLNDSVLCVSTEGNGIFAFDCVNHCFLKGFRHSDGLQSSLFLQASSTRDDNDRIIFGGDQGAVVLRASDLLTEQHSFNIFVVGKSIEDNTVTLPHDARNLDIQFTTNDINHQSEYTFYYKIQGMTEEWQTIDDSRHVRFGQLPAGDYKLEIRAVGAANQTASLSINVVAEQDPWLRWYSIAGYIFAIALLTSVILNAIYGFWSKSKIQLQ